MSKNFSLSGFIVVKCKIIGFIAMEVNLQNDRLELNLLLRDGPRKNINRQAEPLLVTSLSQHCEKTSAHAQVLKEWPRIKSRLPKRKHSFSVLKVGERNKRKH